MPPSPPKPVKRERRKQARPVELLEAALDLFVERGFAATRVEQIAARAGVSKGTLFLYYPSKQALFQAVVQQSLASRMAGWQAEYEQFDGSSADLLRHYLNTWWSAVGNTRASGIIKLVMTEAHNFPEVAAYYHQAVIQPARELVRRIMQRGIDSGEFRAVDADHAVYTVISAIAYIVLAKHSLPLFEPPQARMVPERYIATHLDILVHGLLRPGL